MKTTQVLTDDQAAVDAAAQKLADDTAALKVAQDTLAADQAAEVQAEADADAAATAQAQADADAAAALTAAQIPDAGAADVTTATSTVAVDTFASGVVDTSDSGTTIVATSTLGLLGVLDKMEAQAGAIGGQIAAAFLALIEEARSLLK